MNIRTLIWGGLSLAALNLSAQSTPLSIERALFLAETQNAQVQVNDMERDVAKQVLRQNIALGLPSISAAAQYVDNIELPAQFFDINQDGVIDKLRFGTRYSSVGNVSVNQLVFDGSYFVAVLAAQVVKDIAEADYEKAIIDARIATANAYHLNVILAENEKVLEQNLQLIAQNVVELEAMASAGLIEAEEVDQLRLSMGSLQANLNFIRAQQSVADNLLKLQCNLNPDAELQLTTSLNDLLASPAFNVVTQTDESFDVAQHIDYRSLAAGRMGTQLQLQNERVQFLPKVYASYGWNQQYVSEDAMVWDPDGTMANSTQFSSWSISSSWDLFTSGRRLARVQEQKIKLAEMDLMLDNTAQALTLQFQTAKSELVNALSHYRLQTQNEEIAKRLLDQARIKLTQGVIGSMEFTQVQTQYQQAVAAKLSAAQQVLDKGIALEKAQGIQTQSK